MSENAPEADTKNPISTLPYENHTGSPHLFFKKLIAGNNILRNKYAAINGNTSGRINFSERHTTVVISASIASVLSKERVFIKNLISAFLFVHSQLLEFVMQLLSAKEMFNIQGKKL